MSETADTPEFTEQGEIEIVYVQQQRCRCSRRGVRGEETCNLCDPVESCGKGGPGMVTEIARPNLKPETEVSSKPTRRKFTAQEKLDLLKMAAACRPRS